MEINKLRPKAQSYAAELQKLKTKAAASRLCGASKLFQTRKTLNPLKQNKGQKQKLVWKHGKSELLRNWWVQNQLILRLQVISAKKDFAKAEDAEKTAYIEARIETVNMETVNNMETQHDGICMGL